MELIRSTEYWQRAAASNVRIEAMVKGFGIRLDQEFDEHDSEYTKYVVALEGVFPIGTCRLFPVDDRTAKIERVCVLEEYRSKGVGRQVIVEAENWLKELGFEKIRISSRVEAAGFYEKLGYQVDWDSRTETGVFACVDTEKVLNTERRM